MQLGATYGTICITIIQPDFELETTLRIIEENAELEGHTKKITNDAIASRSTNYDGWKLIVHQLYFFAYRMLNCLLKMQRIQVAIKLFFCLVITCFSCAWF